MSDERQNFQLYEYQVPDPPEKPVWPDILRWMICVMDNDDRALPFIASVYAYSLKNGGTITEKQFLVASRHAKRVLDQWNSDTLVCQNIEEPSYADHSTLASMKTEGTA